MKSIGPDNYSLKVLTLCLIGWTLANMDQSFFGYAIPSLMTEFEIDLVIIGIILSVAFILASFSVVLAGFLADRYGRRSMFVFCLSVSALLVGLHSFAESIETMAVLRCVAFAVSTGLVPITNSFVVESAPTRLRGIYSGILQCGYPLGWFFASLIATPLLTDFGWRAMFLPALAVIPIAFLMGKVLPESTKFSELSTQVGMDPKKLIPGTGLCNLPDTIEITKHAIELGCLGAMTLPPFYFKGMSDDGLFDYFEKLQSDELTESTYDNVSDKIVIGILQFTTK